MKVSFSLAKKPQPTSQFQLKKPPAPTQKPSLFNADDDDDERSLTSDSKPTKNGLGLQTVSAEASKAQKKRELAEMAVDSTVYQYDEVWDKIQVAKQKVKEAKVAESKERKPKYIEGLLTSASTRRLDRLRAEEKMIQREREMEGEEFKDKESFVTQAYKDQMAELRKAEEEEKLRDEAEKKKRKGFGGGMAQFYQKLLEEEAKAHDETVALTTSSSDPSSSKQPLGPNLTITKPPTSAPPIPGTKSDLELVNEAAQKGIEIELNDDNQIVDKRELLAAGLNLSMANTRKLGSKSSALSSSNASSEPVNAHRAAGVAASRSAINTRRAMEIQTQIAEEEERMRLERERREREANERIIAKRNSEEDIQSARERYLARKRRKLEEEQTAQDQPQADDGQQPS
ncbi:coiled-coil domain-containing protein 55-domain containing protein [Thelephora terrestris]|uniref:Coiled-coil domain-containing protein 55-domain containing protein n=1 Tax=Thelephora terrestris TaxID=56493 RepID=A0A9P6L2J1_9AGAM|nr:coiled-coil domain-containing protein 55-domain containing protein [Thelephora terrestris]